MPAPSKSFAVLSASASSIVAEASGRLTPRTGAACAARDEEEEIGGAVPGQADGERGPR
jgi:hypothetical protein